MRGKGTLKRNVDGEEFLKTYVGLREGMAVITYPHGRTDSAKKIETAMSGGRPKPARKEKKGTSVVEWGVE